MIYAFFQKGGLKMLKAKGTIAENLVYLLGIVVLLILLTIIIIHADKAWAKISETVGKVFDFSKFIPG
jgi:hypothetical protein